MLRIRLRRVGKKGNPSYRIVVAESTSPRDGKYLEWIGNYDPMANPPAVTIKEDRASQPVGLTPFDTQNTRGDGKHLVWARRTGFRITRRY